jgi:hypothetical protein
MKEGRMSNTELRVKIIRTDGGTQSRVQLDWLAVDEYTHAMLEGATFPPVVVFHDGQEYWCADGFHRLQAAERAGRELVDADGAPLSIAAGEGRIVSLTAGRRIRIARDTHLADEPPVGSRDAAEAQSIAQGRAGGARFVGYMGMRGNSHVFRFERDGRVMDISVDAGG